MAYEIIDENHPLNQTPLEKAFPILKPFIKCCKKEEQQEEGFQQHLLDDKQKRKGTKQKKPKVSEEDLNRDPYLLLGYGMIAYRDLMLTLICIFALFSALMIPAFIFYTGQAGYGTTDGVGFASAYSLGSFGYSYVGCT